MFKQIIVLAGVAAATASVPNLVEKYGPSHNVSLSATQGSQDDSAKALPKAASLQVAKEAPASYVTGERVAQIKMNSNGHFTANFRMNGKVVHGVVDTGATFVAMNMSTARKIGIRPTMNDFRYEVSTANGIARAARVTVSRMEIGSIEVSGVDAFIMEDKALSDTLIGMSFMSKLGAYGVDGRTLKLKK